MEGGERGGEMSKKKGEEDVRREVKSGCDQSPHNDDHTDWTSLTMIKQQKLKCIHSIQAIQYFGNGGKKFNHNLIYMLTSCIKHTVNDVCETSLGNIFIQIPVISG